MPGDFLTGLLYFQQFYNVSRDGEHNKDLLSPLRLSLMSIPDVLGDTAIINYIITYDSPSLLWKL